LVEELEAEMMIKPRQGLILQPFDGSDKCFAFTTDGQIGAYVLDIWSHTILEALQTETAESVLEHLTFEADATAAFKIAANFRQTIDHLEKLNLVERI
jgi:hypothetical protein